jgi:hypothetical protein
MLADQPITTDRPAVVIDFAEITEAIVDLTRVLDWLGSTKTLPAAPAASMERLRRFSDKLQSG